MTAVPHYRCPKCGKEYRPRDAGARRWKCCDVELEHTAPPSQDPVHALFAFIQPILESKREAASASSPPTRLPTRVIEVIPPRENTIDALAVEAMLQSLGTDVPISLEIAGDANRRHFLVRADGETISYLQSQLQAVYDQAVFRELAPEQDPARNDGGITLTAQLTLRRPAYLPLRSYREGDFKTADPVRGLLGAFSDLGEEERALSQLVLLPAPPNWARRYEGSARQVEQSHSYGGEKMTFGLYFRQFFAAIGSMIAIGLGVWSILAYIQHDYLTFLGVGILAGLFISGLGYAYALFTESEHIDPKLIQRKIELPAYDVTLRLVATGKTSEQAQARLKKLATAYRQFNLGSGNALVLKALAFDSQRLTAPRFSLLQELLAHVDRLNVGELASMWHLPVGTDVERVERSLSKRILPDPSTVAEGMLVGYSSHQGKRIPVHLEPANLWRHTFLVAKTQKGKSTLMAHLAAEAMKQDAALVVVDPHGDLARSLLGLVPPSRANEVIYVDLADPHQVIGLNLLDVTQGRSADVLVSNLVATGEVLWRDYWGPRMESAFRGAALTLLAANEVLVSQGKPQFGLLDIPALFRYDNFRHRLLEQYVKDKEIRDFWSGYYESLYESLQIDVVNPVLTKIHRFATHKTVRRIVGQSRSTVNFRQLIDERGILLLNTASGIIGSDAGALLGAVIVGTLNSIIRNQLSTPDQAARPKVLVIMDEFQSIPGVNYQQLLAESQKMGASFVLATQSLKQLDEISPSLRSTITANVSTLFVFQTNAEDADVLRHELDEVVGKPDITNLDDYAAYLKTQKGHSRLPTMHLDTLPPGLPDRRVVERILSQMSRHTHSAALADAEIDAFEEEWYGRERAMLYKLMIEGKLLGSHHRKSFPAAFKPLDVGDGTTRSSSVKREGPRSNTRPTDETSAGDTQVGSSPPSEERRDDDTTTHSDRASGMRHNEDDQSNHRPRKISE